jgi:hypothetical protein
MAKKDTAVKRLGVISAEIKRSIPVLPNANWVMFGALLSSLILTLFSYQVNKLKGAAKSEFEVGMKTLETKRRNAAQDGASGEEEMSPLMRRLEEMKKRGEAQGFTEVTDGGNDESDMDMDAMMLDRIFQISEEIGEYHDGDLQKAPLDELKAKGLEISDYTHRKIIDYGVSSGKLFQKVPRGAYYFKKAA